VEAMIEPVGPLRGLVVVPGDKSIAQRALLLGSLALGESRVAGVPGSGDVASMTECLRRLGVQITPVEEVAGGPRGKTVIVRSAGMRALVEPTDVLDVGNSGTAMRLLIGVATGLAGLSVLTGDPSVRRRPMDRVAAPLRGVGASIWARGGDLAPIAVVGGTPIKGGVHELPMASAQVKSALLLAGLCAEGETTVYEPRPSRDHTERLLAMQGVGIQCGPGWARVAPCETLSPIDLEVPGDISSAAFLLGAAAVVPGSEVTVEGVGLNPRRTGFLDVLRSMGAQLTVEVEGNLAGEPSGRVSMRYSQLTGARIGPDMVADLIDELPLLAGVASHSVGCLEVSGAGELRVKESDRIAAIAAGLGRLGVEVETWSDGFRVVGGQPTGGSVDPAGDHRIAMMAAVVGLAGGGKTRIGGWECTQTSFPGFLEILAGLSGDGQGGWTGA